MKTFYKQKIEDKKEKMDWNATDKQAGQNEIIFFHHTDASADSIWIMSKMSSSRSDLPMLDQPKIPITLGDTK